MEVFLSPDAFAHRTSEASIAEQLSEVLVSNGLPRAVAADDDRIGGWQLMYQLMETDAWSITENCRQLIESLPLLIRDERRVEDIRKVDGDDAADAARYGLVSGGRIAGVGAGLGPPGAAFRSPHINGSRFCERDAAGRTNRAASDGNGSHVASDTFREITRRSAKTLCAEEITAETLIGLRWSCPRFLSIICFL